MMDWFGPLLYEYYAASEGYGTSISPQDWLAHRGSVGHKSSDGAEVAIINDNGGDVPAGEIGMLSHPDVLGVIGIPDDERG